ncbi:ABC transporter permease [Nitratireductor mangrovi]|uniref:ABC transporter permease n=1 Tax=Nitratireductor mangrovi TaxID=2599600 RepID=A0A5B8L147_9HYPH|nr:ABC transporter permease [Nitratireductor mangrovi]QDZ01298.1 ABC transporter permease [Nitratireductor mangrovi]
MDEAVFVSALLAAGIRLAAPIALAALGETLAQRSGVINVGLEGIMLVGAFVAVLMAVQTQSPWIGLAGAIFCGAAMGALHAYFSVILKVEQIVTGIALLFLGMGLSGYGYRLTIGMSGSPVAVPGFRPLDLFGLSDLPVVGAVLFGQHALVYLTLVAAALMAWMFRATRLGIMIKAAGEYPVAAAAAGIDVDRIRLACVTVGGAFAGAAGAFLSTAHLWGFVENMTAGRGFLAIACVVFARWKPWLAVAVALVFGIADASQIRIQSVLPMVPYQFFVIVPYMLAIVALAFGSGRNGMPAALGTPFTRHS